MWLELVGDILIGCGIGLIDESIKVLLPTREFDFVDLVKDWIGVAVGTGVVAISQHHKKEISKP